MVLFVKYAVYRKKNLEPARFALPAGRVLFHCGHGVFLKVRFNLLCINLNIGVTSRWGMPLQEA